jgi:hypothetical protein
MPGEDPLSNFEFLASDAERKAGQATALHVVALWREFATSYRELADYYRPSASTSTEGCGQ